MSESEFDSVPRILFKTRTNTELGAEAVEFTSDGEVVFRGVLKQVTESMLTSYPRTLLGKWTPNRAAIRFDRDELGDRNVRRFEDGKALDLASLESLAR